jgi:hypothetical protein
MTNVVVLSSEQNAERKYCTRQSAARYLDCDPSTVARWADKLGLSVFYDPEGRPRYLWAEIERLISRSRPKEFRTVENLDKARAAARESEVRGQRSEVGKT